MKNQRLADRYARGMLESLGTANGEIEGYAVSLREFSRLYRRNQELRHALLNPAFPLEERQAVITALVSKMDAPQGVASLLVLLLKRDRFQILPEVATMFSRLVDEQLNRVNVLVTTAAELNEAQERRIEQALSKYTGKSVRCDYEVEPALLGGVVARVGNLLLDGSLATRITHLKEMLIPEERTAS